jgi:D-3-phosphoglycerate dehydrogenase / 2-oxoglutarate reductase
MRLLIADKLHPRAIDELRTLPLEVLYEPEMTKESLPQKIAGVGILVVRSTEVTSDVIDQAGHLHLIVRAGAEYSTIDVRAASRRGIYVANCPGKNAAAVAELVYGLILSIDRRIPDALASLRAGKWERVNFGGAEGLHGKTLGIAGFGAVGREVAAKARAFGLTPIAWGRSLTAAKASELGVGHVATLDDLAARSQILSVHLPITEKTKKLFDKRLFSLLPPRAIFINTAREGLVDEVALREAVKERKLRVGLDVFADEPKNNKREFRTDLFAPPQPGEGFVYGTPHIAASTDQAQLAIATETVRVIRSFLLQGRVPNVVNVSPSSVARFQIVIRMVDRVGTFANVLNVIKRHGINVEEVTNTVFDGGEASCAKLRVVSRPSEACLAEITAFEEVLHIDMVPLPNLA